MSSGVLPVRMAKETDCRAGTCFILEGEKFSHCLLLYNDRIVLPLFLREKAMSRLHESHQGIEPCRRHAKCSVWWPGISKQLAEALSNCTECTRDVSLRKEPTPLPKYLWQMVGSDLFMVKGDTCALVVDYFSRYPEIIKPVSASVIAALQTIFTRHGIPEIIRSDNGPQYSADEFDQFTKSHGIQHITSSLGYPQRNGLVERMVRRDLVIPTWHY